MITRKELIATLRQKKPDLLKLGVQNVGLFGSYQRDEQSDKSDIDLLIEFMPQEETFDNLMAVQDLLETVFKKEKIDVITKNGLSKHIGPKILKDVLYV